MRYHRPTSLAEAVRLHAEEPEARLLAGGTDVLVQLRDGRRVPPALIALSRVAGLAGIADEDGALIIGAATTVADLAARCPLAVIAQAARAVGSPQIRNVATVGGNLCNASPCADLAPPLLVLDASVRLEGPEGRRSLPLEDFFEAPGQTRLRPGEILTAIEVPRPAPGTRAAFAKHGRVAMDLALASVAVLVAPDGRVRVAAGSVAPRPIRLRGVEAALAADPTAIAEARELAAREVQPISDVRAGAAYRRHLVGALLARALREARS
jgi:CO/xanthine dehydrogenase FAD-binding subunit